MAYTSAAEIVKKHNEAKKKKFDELLAKAKAKGNLYRYDPKNHKHKANAINFLYKIYIKG